MRPKKTNNIPMILDLKRSYKSNLLSAPPSGFIMVQIIAANFTYFDRSQHTFGRGRASPVSFGTDLFLVAFAEDQGLGV